MPDPILYFQAMGAAAIVTGTVVLVSSLMCRKWTKAWLDFACVLAIGLGLTAGIHVLDLQLAWPPVSALGRLLRIVIPATLLVESIAGLPMVPSRLGWLMRIILAAVIPRVLLHGSVYVSDGGEWTTLQAVISMGGCGVLLAACWSLLHVLSGRCGGVSIALAVCLSIPCAGAAVMMAGYIKGGSAALPLVATLLAATTAVWLASKRCKGVPKGIPSAVVGVGVVGLFGVLFVGHFFGRVSTGSAVVMLLAPLLCWATEANKLRNRAPWVVGSVRLALVAIPLVVVLVLAKRAFDRDLSPLVSHRSLSIQRKITVVDSMSQSSLRVILAKEPGSLFSVRS